jgi:uncharacterized protein (DUF2252 family)
MSNNNIAKTVVPLSASAHERALQEGRTLRQKVSRSAHAVWKVPAERPDPVAMLLQTSDNRLPHLLPLRYGRMSASPFAYMRGSAAMMAADVATTPLTGLRVQACGDCHSGNFGAFASPERRVLFDITDFDETLPAPWEFDVKRLAVSFVLLARHQGYDKATVRDVTLKMLRAYRTRLAEFATMAPLDVWYYIIDSELLIRTAPDKATRRRRERFEKRARARTADKLLGRLMVEDHGRVQFIDQLPTIARLQPGSELEASFRTALERYPQSLSDDRRFLLSRYRLDDLAFKVVGVGSVGTRCAVALYVAEGGQRLVLQVKEACPSVLEPHIGKCPFAHQGQRVVVGQRLMQCASDIFLGWASDDAGRHYYVRQLRDMKTNLSLEELQGPVLFNFADMCGWALARAHAKSGDAVRLSGYVGNSDRLDEAVADFAAAYADQCEKDYELFRKAINDGKIPVEIETQPPSKDGG